MSTFQRWDRIEENDFARVVTDAVTAMFVLGPPRFLVRTPHGYRHNDQIEADLRPAGFSNIQIETMAQISAAPSPRDPAIAYCQGTPLRNEIEARDKAGLEKATIREAVGCVIAISRAAA
jgi:hypothetical protein